MDKQHNKDMPDAKAAHDPFEPFLGPDLRDVDGSTGSVGGRLKRYPPMAVILAKCPLEAAPAARAAVEAWLSDTYGVQWVFAMPTFQPPTH